MKMWIFALPLEPVHPILLCALVLIRKKRSNCSDSNSDNADPPSKKVYTELVQPSTMKRKYSKNWENEFNWLVHYEGINGAFFRVFKLTSAERIKQNTGGVCITKPFQNWKKSIQK